MSEETDFASKISSEAPWWSKAPIWLAAGIVGVPSLIAIAAGWYIAGNINHRVNVLDQYSLSEIHLLNELMQDHKTIERDFDRIQEFTRATLRAAQQNCLNNA